MLTWFSCSFVFCFQDMFAFLNKKNLRQYIYKVNYLLIYVYISHSCLYLSDSLMQADLIVVQRNVNKATVWPINCAFCCRTSSTVLAPSRTRWPTTSTSSSQLPWITWSLAWGRLWTVTARWAIAWQLTQSENICYCSWTFFWLAVTPTHIIF